MCVFVRWWVANSTVSKAVEDASGVCIDVKRGELGEGLAPSDPQHTPTGRGKVCARGSGQIASERERAGRQVS